jgi:hypothetical protein
MISCHALDGISTPQTLNIEEYIKKKVTHYFHHPYDH